MHERIYFSKGRDIYGKSFGHTKKWVRWKAL